MSVTYRSLVMWRPYGNHLGNPIYGDSPYGTMGSLVSLPIWVAHICMFAGLL